MAQQQQQPPPQPATTATKIENIKANKKQGEINTDSCLCYGQTNLHTKQTLFHISSS